MNLALKHMNVKIVRGKAQHKQFILVPNVFLVLVNRFSGTMGEKSRAFVKLGGTELAARWRACEIRTIHRESLRVKGDAMGGVVAH
jgi:hypothetical protein